MILVGTRSMAMSIIADLDEIDAVPELSDDGGWIEEDGSG